MPRPPKPKEIFNPDDFEKKIREQRKIEASQKGLTGASGKLKIIVAVLGQPIISHSEGGGLWDIHYLDEQEQFDIEKARNAKELNYHLPTMDMLDDAGNPINQPDTEEWAERQDPVPVSTDLEGWHFNGLSHSMHLEIKYDNLTNTLTCHYKGYEVFREAKGELLGYYPIPEWETWVDKLFTVAKTKVQAQKKQEAQENTDAGVQERKSWIEKVRLRWGF